ncbi:sphingomyelin phosphodiesterase-like [Uloborus diversus]|uniref:sphingomyelin phosphodiesterase-like n=1 Tax=Uloborus diversus TaxID=327109 RepID=UPI0024098531|nr:sphingomyelin phosphodiesterase-like [Uloborus diversus]
MQIITTALGGPPQLVSLAHPRASPVVAQSRLRRVTIDDLIVLTPGCLEPYLRCFKFIKNIGKKFEVETACLSCKFAVAFLQHYANSGATENDIGSIVNKICSLFHIEKPRVCHGLTELFKGEVTYVLANVALDPSEFCGVLIEGCGKVVNPLHNWTIPLTPFPKPPVRPPLPPKPGAPIARVLHLSDVHLDPLYQEGSNADCGEPLCCREDSGKPAGPRTTAGYWGDYRNCDLPLRTLENMLSHINRTHKVDYVIWTGDIPPHDIWNNTRKEAVYLLHAASKLIHKYLGHVPVFPALGNHESSPVNSFPIPTIKGNESISWLYNEVAKAWSPWLPDSSFTLKLGAYYSVLVNPGFRIVSINMNYCNSLNWWLLLNSTDPTNELSWLVSELQKAETKNEKVHILGHIPPGAGDCLPVWSANFNKIINRYESTVTAQFFGHTHNDEFEIFYDKSGPKSRPVSIGYIGPSVTTYDGLNPGYRIYTVDGNYPKSSRVVLDHETYYMNLTEANLYNKPVWRFEYSAKKAYNLTSLLPTDWDSLTYRFFKDDELFQKFYRFFYKMSDYPVEPCDETCKKEYLCRLRRGKSDDPLIC